MTTITTKYSVGDIVYYANTIQTQKQHPCPDCKGTREWKAISLGGGEYTIGCPRCNGYQSDPSLSLTYQTFEPIVERLTIGSVQYNSKPSFESDSTNKYMCTETGVGSGSIYSEAMLFPNYDEAMGKAEAIALGQRSNIDWVKKLYHKTLSISEYQLSDAKIKAAKEEFNTAVSILYNFRELRERLKEADAKEDMLHVVDDYIKYHLDDDLKEAGINLPKLRVIATDPPPPDTYVLLVGDSGYITTPLRYEVGKFDEKFRPLNPWVDYGGDAFTDNGPPPIYWHPLLKIPKEETNV